MRWGVVAICLLWLTPTSQAEPRLGYPLHAASLSWWVDVSEHIAEATVQTRTVKRVPHDSFSDLLTFTTKIDRVRKGAAAVGDVAPPILLARAALFRVGYSGVIVKPGSSVLLFWVGSGEAQRLLFWCSLDATPKHSDKNTALTDAGVIIQGVQALRDALSVELARIWHARRNKRGVIHQFDNRWEDAPAPGVPGWMVLTTPAEPKFHKVFLDQLALGTIDKAVTAAYSLVSYPGPETEQLLRQMLADTRFWMSGRRTKDGWETVRVLAVREAAYTALDMLGVKVEKPALLNERETPWHFAGLFEDPDAYPYGDWPQDF